jgi:hypothetical protein
MVRAIDFICPLSIVEVRFVEAESTLKWYKGIVKKVKQVDLELNYVIVDVEYDDDGSVWETTLHEEDFDCDNHIDAWRFCGTMSQVIKKMIEYDQKIHELGLTPCDDEDASESTQSCSSDQGSYKGSWIGFMSLLVICMVVLCTRLYIRYGNMQQLDSFKAMLNETTVCNNATESFKYICPVLRLFTPNYGITQEALKPQ